MDNNQLDMSLDISGYIEEKYRDNYFRTGVSMYRYDKKGSGRDLFQTILTLVNDILSMDPLDKLNVLCSLKERFLNEDGIYEIPYDRETFKTDVELVKFLCKTHMEKPYAFDPRGHAVLTL